MNAPEQQLGQMLLGQGVLSEDQWRIVLLEQKKSSQPVGKLLVRLGFVSEATLREVLSASLGERSVDLSRIIIAPEALRLVPRELARRHRLLPLDFDATRQHLMLAVADSNDIVALDQVRHHYGANLSIETLLAGEAEIERAIDQHYGYELSIDGILHEIETGEVDWRSLQAASDAYSQPVVRLIDALLADAVKREASDIHFEPEANFLRIRYRIDGMLRQIRALHKSYWPAMAVRLKVISGMDIAETRAPQDGRLHLTLSGRPIDFRVAALPTIHGENIVLRLLDRQKGIVPLPDLGLADDHLARLKRMIARPEGLLLVTGPTGSGKTTTLYSILNHLNAEGVNIMTLEDPVEYPLAQVRQTSVAESVKLDFANGIRAMMRQDPDVILVGEIRDGDTASMAFRAAMTGHQVYSTLHTNTALGAIPRLIDIGIPAALMAGTLMGIVAQRLVRRLCPECKTSAPANEQELQLLGQPPSAARPLLYHPRGCERCEFQGYRGRLAIMELLPITAALEDGIVRQASLQELQSEARTSGFRTLAEDGLRRVLDGSTSLAELSRVVALSACR